MTPFAKWSDRAVFALVILVLVLTPFAFGGVNQTKALLDNTFLSPVLFYSNYFARLGIALAVMLWLVNMIAGRQVRFARTPLDIPIGLFVGYTLLWFIFTRSKFITGGELANVVAYVALYYVVVNVVRTRFRMNILVGTLLFWGFVIATIGLTQSSGYFISSSGIKLDYALNLVRPRQYWGRVGGTFVCPNHFAGYLEMVIPFALAYVLFSKFPVGRKILIAFCGLVMIMGLLLSISRGGWGGFAVSAGFLFAVATRQKKVPVAAWLIPLVAILAGVGLVLAKSPRVQKRFAGSLTREDASYLKRMHVWLDTMSLVRDHLLLGTGPGTFELAYRECRRPSMLVAIRYTHNDYLHALSDYGFVGFAILLSGIITFGRKIWRAARKVKRSIDKALSYGVLGAVVALLAHSLVDFNMHIPSNAMTMAAIVGLGMCIRQYRVGAFEEWVALAGQRRAVFPPILQYGLMAVVIAATAGVLYINFRAYASLLTLHRATEKDPAREFRDQDPMEKDPEAAERLYREAASLFPSNPKPWASMAAMYVWKGDRALAKGEETDRFKFLLLFAPEAKRDYQKAADPIKKAIERSPSDSSYYLALARAYAGIYYVNREYKEGLPSRYSPSLEKYAGMAEAQFHKALEMEPNGHDHRGYLGAFYYKAGRYAQAETEVRQALEILGDDQRYAKERKDLQKLLNRIRQKKGETAGTPSAF